MITLNEAIEITKLGKAKLEYRNSDTDEWRLFTAQSNVNMGTQFRLLKGNIISTADYKQFCADFIDALKLKLNISDELFNSCFIIDADEYSLSILYRMTAEVNGRFYGGILYREKETIVSINLTTACVYNGKVWHQHCKKMFGNPKDMYECNEIFITYGFRMFNLDDGMSNIVAAYHLGYYTNSNNPYPIDKWVQPSAIALYDRLPEISDIDKLVSDIMFIAAPLVNHFTTALKHASDYITIASKRVDMALIQPHVCRKTIDTINCGKTNVSYNAHFKLKTGNIKLCYGRPMYGNLRVSSRKNIYWHDADDWRNYIVLYDDSLDGMPELNMYAMNYFTMLYMKARYGHYGKIV